MRIEFCLENLKRIKGSFIYIDKHTKEKSKLNILLIENDEFWGFFAKEEKQKNYLEMDIDLQEKDFSKILKKIKKFLKKFEN